MGGTSGALLHEDQMCKWHRCRDLVANAEDGDLKFVVDKNGIKWKCANRRNLPRAEAGGPWACIELQCSKKGHGILKHAFRWDSDCKGKREVVTDVDAQPVLEAPEKG